MKPRVLLAITFFFFSSFLYSFDPSAVETIVSRPSISLENAIELSLRFHNRSINEFDRQSVAEWFQVHKQDLGAKPEDLLTLGQAGYVLFKVEDWSPSLAFALWASPHTAATELSTWNVISRPMTETSILKTEEFLDLYKAFQKRKRG